MQEILPAIKLIKYYGWEQYFEDKVNAIRAFEKKLHFGTNCLKIFNVTLVFCVPPLTAFVIFSAYEFEVKRLNSTLSFTALTLLNIMRFPLVVLPKALRAASGGLLDYHAASFKLS